MSNAPGDGPSQNGSPSHYPTAPAKTLNSIQTVQLNQWFHNEFEPGWLAIEELLVPTTGSVPSSAESTAIRRAALIWFNPPLNEHPADGILVVTLSQGSDRQVAIQFQIHAISEAIPLAEKLTLTVIDEVGATFLETTAAAGDRLLQMPKFQGRPGERFRGLIALDHNSIAIDFVI